jgi:SAM-dependent methyltransferase
MAALMIDVQDDWDVVGVAWTSRRPQRLWREFTDRNQLSLVDRWLTRVASAGGRSNRHPGRGTLLKTDLFDEVAGRGVVAALTAAGLRVTAVDISPVVVAAAAARNPGLEVFVADVRTLPFGEAMFDGVLSWSTLDHFESTADIQRALVEIRRVIRSGGRLILTMDNPAHPLIRLRNGPLLPVLRWLGIVPYQVGATLEQRALAAMVWEAGFDLLDITAVMHCPRVIAVALAGLVERMPTVCRGPLLRCLAACEGLERLPSRWITGHFIAVHAQARS